MGRGAGNIRPHPIKNASSSSLEWLPSRTPLEKTQDLDADAPNDSEVDLLTMQSERFRMPWGHFDLPTQSLFHSDRNGF